MAYISNDVLLATVEEHGKTAAARILGINTRGVFRRIRDLKKKGVPVRAPVFQGSRRQVYRPPEYPEEVHFDIEDGTVLIGSDPHYWPGIVSTGHRAFVRFCKEMAPTAVIMNGDVLDGSQISRHPPLGWERRPELYQELETANERLNEIEQAVPRRCHLIWPCGNHDARFEKKLAEVSPEFRKVAGVHLKDHFHSCWVPCYTAWINGEVFVIHAYKGGVHHAYNDTLHAGMTTVTGDKHSLQVTRFSDLKGDRWGVDTGTLADPYGPQFEYALGKPRNHCSGFIVLTFEGGRLLWPEVVHVVGPDQISFRGKIIDVSEPKAPRSPKAAHARSKAKKPRRRGRRR